MFRCLLFLVFAALSAALQIIHPAQDETIRADFKYEIQWTVSLPCPFPPSFTFTSTAHLRHLPPLR